MVESVENLRIDYSNFRQNRKAYGITIDEIAKKSGLSSSVVSHYENFTGQYTQTRPRDDNARRIVRALKDLIQNKIDSVFFTPIKKKKEEEKMVEDSLVLGEVVTLDELAKEAREKQDQKHEKKVAAKGQNYKNGYNKEKIINKLRSYCDENKILFSDFCKMCNINHSTLAPYSIKVTPILSERLMVRICEATGWDISKFDEDKYFEQSNSITTTAQKAKSKNTATFTLRQSSTETGIAPIAFLPVHKEEPKAEPDNVEIKDRKYTFQDGVCYEEYTEIRYVKRTISKEQFMTAIQHAS